MVQNRIIITGVDGFIGRYLKYYLINSTKNVFVGDYDITHGCDILSKEKLDLYFEKFKPNGIFHLAGQTDVSKGEENPSRDVELNVIGTLNIIEAMKNHGVKDLVYTSTAAAINPISNYGISKGTAEKYIKKYSDEGVINGRIARFSSVYGHGRTRFGKPQGAVNNFIHQALTTGFINVWGDGEQKRDIIYVKDAVRALTTIMNIGMPGIEYNVGTGEQVSVNQIAKLVSSLTKAPIIHVPSPVAVDQRDADFDTFQLKRLFALPEFGLLYGIAETLKYMKEDMK